MVVDMVSMSTKPPIGFAEITARTGLPAQTLRRYGKEFARWLPTRKVGRVVQFQADAVEIIEAIRAGFEAGKTTPEVRDLLAAHVSPVLDLPGDPPAEDTTPTTIPTTPPPAGLDAATLAAVLPMVDRWLAVQERQADLMGRAVAALETLASRLPLPGPPERPQDASEGETRPDAPGRVKTANNGPHIAPPSPERRAAIMGEVERLRSAGHGGRAIARAMNAAGWPTLSGRGRWGAGAVKRILKGGVRA